MIIGGLIILVLMAALVGPYLIDWNAFRSTFEARATDILGQKVRIVGNADVTLLPVPTVILETIEVGDTEGAPMATIERFEMRLELLPLLRGQFIVSSMTVDRPQVAVTIDDTGMLDWMLRQTGESTLDPARVALEEITIIDGGLQFFDARTGAMFAFSQINTNLFQAGSLAGPWRIEGNLVCSTTVVCGEALPVSFRLASGRVADDGSIRLSAEITPASAALAGTLTTDGILRREAELLAYVGDLRFEKLAQSGASAEVGPGDLLTSAWTMGGDIELDMEKAVLDGLAWESSDGLLVVTGDATLSFGENLSFDAVLESRQIDLDRLLGEGPATAVAVSEASAEIWRRVGGLAPFGIPGRFSLTVPSLIVSGSVLQDVAAEIVVAADYWQIEALRAQLPGRTLLALSGRLEPGPEPNFHGDFEVRSDEPPVLASWWSGRDYSRVELEPFVFGASVIAGPGVTAVEEFALVVGEASLNGSFRWSRATDALAGDRYTVDMDTASFDLNQLRTLAELFFEPILSNPGDDAVERSDARYTVVLDAEELVVGDVAVRGVRLHASLSSGAIDIDEFSIADLDGAHLEATGSLAGILSDAPSGALTASLSAERFGGIVALAQSFGANEQLTQWLADTAPSLAPLDLQIVVAAPAATGFAYRMSVAGTAAETGIRVEIDTDGGLQDWANEKAQIVIDLDAADSSDLAVQVGLPTEDAFEFGPATIDFAANGVPAEGMSSQLQAMIAGVSIISDGVIRFDATTDAGYSGPIVVSGDLDSLLRLAGIALPNSGVPAPAVLNANIEIDGRDIGIELQPSSIAERAVEGEVRLTEVGDTWRLAGGLVAEEANIGWLATVALGAELLPIGDSSKAWPQTPFTGSALGDIDVSLEIAVGRLMFGTGLVITNAETAIVIGPDQARLELINGSLATGLARGALGVELRDGEAILDGQLFLADVPIESFAWRAGAQPVAEGVLTLSAEFGGLGRSPAGLMSSLVGSGTIEIRQGLFHFLGADAFDLIIRLADEGDAMTEEVLREAFTGFLDAGTLAFGETSVPFDIAAGVLTPSPTIRDVGDVRVVIRSPLDLANLTLDSSWELTLLDERGIEEGPRPRAFVTFSGPLADPVRQVNVTPLAGYLSLRRLRETDQLQAEVLERERFIRILERIEADRDADQGAEAEAEGPLIEDGAVLEQPLSLELPPPAVPGRI